MRLLLDEMYPAALAEALCSAGVEAIRAAELGLAGRSDEEVFAKAGTERWALLTENVADFARLAAEHVAAGRHHPGVLIALSSRFSRRPAGVGPIVAAVVAVADDDVGDRVVYLRREDR